MKESTSLGAWGEMLARYYLERCGFRCEAAGYRRPGGEVDLVMSSPDMVIFVEVKTRGPGACAPPEAWVDRQKLSRMRRMARRWCYEQPSGSGRLLRFDVVAIEFAGAGRGLRLRHLPGVG